ncbi:MAG: class I SAM-dependent methyltransferase [Thiotrichales bacterium]|nr:class I SAM-dependent methyltransferase [Thiotrichales bacterium]
MASISNVIHRARVNVQRWSYARKKSEFSQDLLFTQAACKFPSRNALHAYMHNYHQHISPKLLSDHRRYYSQSRRGFGEDALHSMWWTLLREFKPQMALEIGVYRGQVTSLWGLIAKLNDLRCDVSGISPFSPAGDQVSVYLTELDYLQDTLSSNQYFDLPDPEFIKAFSTDLEAIEFIKSRQWNLIYVDGNHDYDVALADYEVCRDGLAEGGLLVMDDSSLYTDFSPPAFSFAGHPGPSRVVQERAMKELRFLGGVGHNNVFIKDKK